jgi:hypothetical protein
MMTWYGGKIMISTWWISGVMPKSYKQSWTVSNNPFTANVADKSVLYRLATNYVVGIPKDEWISLENSLGTFFSKGYVCWY